MGDRESENDRLLIVEIVGGSEKAFSVLFFKYITVLHSFALKFTKSEQEAEEIIQDAFLRIWLNRDKLDGVDNLKAYIFKYVSNECLTYIRKKIIKDKGIESLKRGQLLAANTTMDEIELNEINRIVSATVENMPEQRKRIYKLSRLQGKTIPQISIILGISPNTVKNTLVTALKAIRTNLLQHGISLLILFIIGS